VRIVGAAYDGPVTAAAPLLRAMPVRAGGTEVTIVVHAESGLAADGPLLRTVRVPERGDSDPVLFAFRAVARGLHRVDVKAYAGCRPRQSTAAWPAAARWSSSTRAARSTRG
jgi:hypothetical protein